VGTSEGASVWGGGVIRLRQKTRDRACLCDSVSGDVGVNICVSVQIGFFLATRGSGFCVCSAREQLADFALWSRSGTPSP